MLSASRASSLCMAAFASVRHPDRAGLADELAAAVVSSIRIVFESLHRAGELEVEARDFLRPAVVVGVQMAEIHRKGIVFLQLLAKRARPRASRAKRQIRTSFLSSGYTLRALGRILRQNR